MSSVWPMPDPYQRPQWAPVTDDTADLLTLLADDGTAQREAEWREFVDILRHVAKWNAGAVSANDMRVHTRALITPQRCGPFYRRAELEGLIVFDGWDLSEDHEGKNAGRPCRKFRWIGGAL